MADMKDLTLYQKVYDFALYAFPILNRFPKNQRFVLAQQIENATLDFSRFVIAANNTGARGDILTKANVEFEVLKFLVRLAKDLKLLGGLHQYEVISLKLTEIGRLLGGWLKRYRG